MKFKDFIKGAWQLPQNTVGLIIKKFCKTTHYTTYNGVDIYSWNFDSGISLGKYIFVPFTDENPTDDYVQQYIKHEYGHTIQSEYLGWFYLFVIGLPSVIWNGCFEGYRKKTGVSYYSFYTEKSADKLGGVER